MPDTHPFKYHPGQRVEATESGGLEIAQDSKNNVMSSKEWPCHYDGCDSIYGRHQEVKRHIREKHAILPKCIICGNTWTRPEKIRKHLLSKHRRHFTEEERQEICHLRGLNDTIDFLKKWEITRL
jgi:hypothetical protein